MQTNKATYSPLPLREEAENDATSLEEGPQESTRLKQVKPLEVESSSSSDENDVGLAASDNVELCSLREPWLLSVLLTLFLLVPTLIKGTWVAFSVTGRMWPATLFSIHLLLALWTAYCLIPTSSIQRSPRKQWATTLPSFLLDAILFGSFYANVCNVLIQYFLTEPDGTTVVEWSTLKWDLQVLRCCSLLIALLRLVTVALAIMTALYSWAPPQTCMAERRVPCTATVLTRLQNWDASWSTTGKHRLRTMLRVLLCVLMALAVGMVVWSTTSFVAHWGNWSAPIIKGDECDALDSTECCLPFPSFHHMVPDASTQTGWRVNLKGNILPPLKGGLRIDPAFLNKLDGFSTMAPLLFYVNGLKEAHEHGNNNTVRLQGPSSIALSVTDQSITLLLDVQAETLVPHSAEIDYLDSNRPMVMVFPARPLNHNTHYALAVVNAADLNGNLLPPTPGMAALFSLNNDLSKFGERLGRYQNDVFPSLTRAAPWFSFEEKPTALQLLFDFQTISANSQLGPVRSVRDATIKHVESKEWGDWSDHVRVVRRMDRDCSRNGTLVARTVHLDMDVPWFLQDFGPGHRDAVLDSHAVQRGMARLMGKTKFVVHVPCSIRAAALNESGAVPLQAVLEFGHGLFYDRAEASDEFLLEMANRNGYIIMAMDWRGMSAFDLLIVVKTLMSTPRLFQAVRDNLIQGYANKLAMQHFSQHGMLEMDWMRFSSRREKNRPIPWQREQPPTTIFYGISQGGILGAGYTALSGPTKLIDRGILGVPGTPFALIMTRSKEFDGYDSILLLNFYNNRHVRILLSLVQMAWDSVEGSGLLSRPLTEPYPPLLLQAGLGDAIVPTIAAEALSRALGASVLPGNPRQDIFGIPVEAPANETWSGPHVALTELFYKEEYESLPPQDIRDSDNWVHVCVRHDPMLIKQVEEFINVGRVIDPCQVDGCFRPNATC